MAGKCAGRAARCSRPAEELRPAPSRCRLTQGKANSVDEHAEVHPLTRVLESLCGPFRKEQLDSLCIANVAHHIVLQDVTVIS
jgi:hypothetical protein